MLSKDEVIIYGSYGVCKVMQITQKEFDGKIVDYYVLKPLYNSNSTVFVPVNNEALQRKMHKVLNRKQAQELIKSMPQAEPMWLDYENGRKMMYNDILARRDRIEVIGLIKALHAHQHQQLEKKRRLHISDERFLKEAEKTLCEELAYALGMYPEDIPSLIKSKHKQR